MGQLLVERGYLALLPTVSDLETKGTVSAGSSHDDPDRDDVNGAPFVPFDAEGALKYLQIAW